MYWIFCRPLQHTHLHVLTPLTSQFFYQLLCNASECTKMFWVPPPWTHVCLPCTRLLMVMAMVSKWFQLITSSTATHKTTPRHPIGTSCCCNHVKLVKQVMMVVWMKEKNRSVILKHTCYNNISLCYNKVVWRWWVPYNL